MNEPIVQTTRPDTITDVSFLWKLYQSTHLTAEDSSDELSKLIDFIRKHSGKTCTVIDSYYKALDSVINIDVVYEFDINADLWKDDARVQIIPALWQAPAIDSDTVIVIGTHTFKYNDIDEYVWSINNIFSRVKSTGNLIVCMPKLHFQYHRLRYQPHELIEQIDSKLRGKIASVLDTQQNFYLNIIHE